MGETVYNKLVRDGIPEIIRLDGQTPLTRILDQAEYRRALLEKRGGFVQRLFLESIETHD